MGIKVDPNNYLEGNYDGENIAEQALQVAQDVAEASMIAKEVEELYAGYIEEGDKKRYLVDGAILKCNQATTAPFEMPDGTRIHLKFKGTELNVKNGRERGRERKYTKLHVPDGKLSSGRLLNATVLDCEQGRNIYPFKCNCKLSADREEELNAIYEYLNRMGRGKDVYSEGGVCQFLMRLNDRWENMPRDTEDFYEMRRVKMDLPTGGGETKEFSVNVPCVTMQSMLFCKHGGLITPQESGQLWKEAGMKKSEVAIKRVSNQLIKLLKDYEGEPGTGGAPVLRTYQGENDPLGTHTIGWGHAMTGESVVKFSDGTELDLYPIDAKINEQQAEELLAWDIHKFEAQLNGILEVYGIEHKVSQCFYDALFDFGFNTGMEHLRDKHWNAFLDEFEFDLGNTREIMLLFGDYTNQLYVPLMCRRLDEIDVAIMGTYTRQSEIQRYGDIFTKKTYPDSENNLEELEKKAREDGII